eukprot:scaffold2522_cov121-Isochrysis_galbana.AAC.3
MAPAVSTSRPVEQVAERRVPQRQRPRGVRGCGAAQRVHSAVIHIMGWHLRRRRRRRCCA